MTIHYFLFNGQQFEEKTFEDILGRSFPYIPDRTFSIIEAHDVPMLSIVHRFMPTTVHVGERCTVTKHTTFCNVFGATSTVYELQYDTQQSPTFPVISVNPSDAFLAHFRAIDINGSGDVRQFTKPDMCRTYAYRWVERDEAIIGRFSRNDRRLTLADGTVYEMVAHRLALHTYAAPVFFKPSHDEIAPQFADVLSPDEREPFYVCTDSYDPCPFCGNEHVGVTMVFKRLAAVKVEACLPPVV